MRATPRSWDLVLVSKENRKRFVLNHRYKPLHSHTLTVGAFQNDPTCFLPQKKFGLSSKKLGTQRSWSPEKGAFPSWAAKSPALHGERVLRACGTRRWTRAWGKRILPQHGCLVNKLFPRGWSSTNHLFAKRVLVLPAFLSFLRKVKKKKKTA